MAKITRVTSTIFASGAASQDIEQFGSKVQTGTPNYTTDPAVIQSLSAWNNGWSAALVVANKSEYKQDRNAVDYVASYQISYLLQQGIAEYDAGTTYYLNSFCTYNGGLYISLVNTNLNNTPPASGATAYWQLLSLPLSVPQPTRTVLTSGSGTYTPPAGCLAIHVQMIGGGGGGAGVGSGAGNGGNGGNTTFGTYTAAAGSGSTSSTPGAGGAASGGSVNISGATGHAPTTYGGGDGASSFFGGAGASGSTAIAGASNSGSGGAGGTVPPGTFAPGGGAGAYIEVIVNNPSGTSYAVGAAGAAGAGATPGGAGGSGIIIITEYYF